MSKQRFRFSVGILIWNARKTRILTVTNRRWGGYSCPGGKIEHGETETQAAIRELYEETGLIAESLKPIITMSHSSVEADPNKDLWVCTYFEATIGDQKPRKIEEETIPSWRTPEEIVKTSLFPDFYKRMFDFLKIYRG